jgi:ABC-type transport system substrate-binding protein
VAAPDAQTLVLRLWAPDAALLEKLAQPRYAVPLAPPERERRVGHALASGAYRLAERGGGGFVLVRRRDYRGAHPGHLDTIRVRTGIAARRAALGLASGAIGLFWPVPVEYRARLARDPRVARCESRGAPLHWFLALNCELAPTARQQARRAVARAVNRQRVVGLMMPLASPWRGYAPGGPPSSAAPGFDPLAAQAALEAADYPRGIQLPVLVARGSRELTPARGLASDLSRAGVYGEIRPRARADFEAARWARRGAVAAFWGWRPPTSDPLSNLAELLLNRGLDDRWGGNVSFFRMGGGAALDTLLLAALREREPRARAAAVEALEARLAEETPFVPVARVREEAFYRRELHAVRFHPAYGLDLAGVWRAP